MAAHEIPYSICAAHKNTKLLVCLSEDPFQEKDGHLELDWRMGRAEQCYLVSKWEHSTLQEAFFQNFVYPFPSSHVLLLLPVLLYWWVEGRIIWRSMLGWEVGAGGGRGTSMGGGGVNKGPLEWVQHSVLLLLKFSCVVNPWIIFFTSTFLLTTQLVLLSYCLVLNP